MQNNFGLSGFFSLVRKLTQGNECAFTVFRLHVHVFVLRLAEVKNQVLESLCALVPSFSLIFLEGMT